MSFLLGDDYASSSEIESDQEDVVTTHVAKEKADGEEELPAQLLPSADSVLSNVSASTASFLAPRTGRSKQQSEVASFDLLKEQETQHREQEEQDERKETDQVIGAPKSDRKRPPPPIREQAAKRDKKDAKEKVKKQRVKGQAGIGSDFRGWKSETEMALRQQFD